MKTLSIVTPCYNEEANVSELYERVRSTMLKLGRYKYEHIFIDNRSTDRTYEILRQLAAADPNVKVIRNTRNFGHLRSPVHAFLQARGDAAIVLYSDLQDPPELIEELVMHWEEGSPIVLAIKNQSRENPLMFWLRSRYYQLLKNVSSIEMVEHFTGFGLYDRKVIEMVRKVADPYPFFRGMIAEIGLPQKKVFYTQERRKAGKSSNNWLSLYDVGMLGLTTFSKVPLRLAIFGGSMGALLSLAVGLGYFVYKLFFWDRFSVGVAPLVIGVFLLGSIQMLFMGLIGEYVGNIFTMVQDRPHVFEDERIKFEHGCGLPLQARAAAASQSKR